MKMHNKGISLIELVGTIGIIVALFALIIPAISTIKNNRKEISASAEIAQLDTALMAFFTDNGYFPKTGQLLASLNDKYFNFDTERIEGGGYKDPWGEPYLYISPTVISSKGYDLYSVGLLMSTGKAQQLARIMSAVSSSNSTGLDEDEVKIGQPTGLDEKTIWGLTEPEYDILIKAAISLLRYTDVGYELAVKINISNIPIGWDDLSGIGALALYDPYDHEILIDLSLSDGPAELIASALAHEATHLADHLGSGDMDFDSIEEEYDAFYNQAMVWEQIKGEKTNALLDNILSVMKQGEKVAREWIRESYPTLPEEDQWGDSYVVAKEY